MMTSSIAEESGGPFRPVMVMIFLFWLAGSSSAAVVTKDLYLRAGSLATIDDRILPALCYSDQAAGGASLMGPVLTLNAGDVLFLTLHNQDVEPHGFEVVGVGGEDSVVPPGGVVSFEYVFPAAGSYLYRDPVDYPLNVGLGLAGAIEVHNPGDVYDGEFLWFLCEHDETWLNTHDVGGAVDTAVYRPDYFTINGFSGSDVDDDPRAHLSGRVGERLLIRVINGGLRLHSMHFHGYHVQVVARNGENLPAPIEKDTIAIPVGETADFILTPHQAGVFPVHDHVVLSVTADGVYPLGMIVFADIQP